MLIRPVDISILRDRSVSIRWSDGSACELPVAALRRACPCATCRALREARATNPLVVIQKPADPAKSLTIDRADLVGNYALRIRWADGHDTGLFDFELLRRLGSETAGQCG